MDLQKWKDKQKTRRALRVRRKVKAARNEMPRMTVFRSSRQVYVQIIDDNTSKTLLAASSMDKEIRETLAKWKNGKPKGNDIPAATKVGEAIAKRAIKAGIKEVRFDRGSYKYHGRIKALADSARKTGLKF